MEEGGGETLADEETMTAIRGRVHHLHQSHKYSHTLALVLFFSGLFQRQQILLFLTHLLISIDCPQTGRMVKSLCKREFYLELVNLFPGRPAPALL